MRAIGEQAIRATRVLVVDDEPNICALLSATLRLTEFDVRTAAGGHDALIVAEEFEPDLVVLDVMLPDLDGFQVAQRLRASRPVPVLFLTARDAVEDRISGLTVGADDYVTKPFSLEEVVLRIRAILRRSRAEIDAIDSAILSYADLEMDEDAHEVRRGGKLIDLSPTEFNLLRYLLDECRPGGVARRRSWTGSGVTTSAATAGSSSRTSTTCAGRSTSGTRR